MGGSGLGLAICKNIVEPMVGRFPSKATLAAEPPSLSAAQESRWLGLHDRYSPPRELAGSPQKIEKVVILIQTSGGEG